MMAANGFRLYAATIFATAIAVTAACSGTGSTSTVGAPSPLPSSTASGSPAPTTDPQIHIASGFVSNTIASVPGARELVGLPNGDLLVGTGGSDIYIVPNAESPGRAGSAHVFI